jgi:hypothetical protein
MHKVNLSRFEVEVLVGSVNYRLYDMDQEFHFYREEPTPLYHQIIELRDKLEKMLTD